MGSCLGDAGYTLGATYVAWSGGERVVWVILSLITWADVSNIYTLEPHHLSFKPLLQKIIQNLKRHCY